MIVLLSGLLGLALIVFVLSDVLRTTLMMRRGGPLTNALGRGVWRLLRRLQRAFPGARLLPGAGVTVLLLTMTSWILLSWLGWLLVFGPHPDAVLDSTTKAPAGLWARAYYVGFSLITLGTGDYVPGSAPFQLLTVLAATQGFFLVTLSITYAVPVISAVVNKRQLAEQILAVGRTPHEMLIASWSGGSLRTLPSHLQGVRASLSRLGQQHLAYPVLRYFPSGQRGTATTVAIPVLDEALTCLLYGVEGGGGVSEAELRPLRATIASYLYNLESTNLEPARDAPPPPDLGPLREAGIPVVPDEAFRARVAELAQRRKLLQALAQDGRRGWDEVVHGGNAAEFYG